MFLALEKENPLVVQAYAESAYACLEEARWLVSRGQRPVKLLALARAAMDRSRAIQADQPLLPALEAAILRLEEDAAQARRLWKQAVARNRNLEAHPEFAGMLPL
jgi:hypothetical protein